MAAAPRAIACSMKRLPSDVPPSIATNSVPGATARESYSMASMSAVGGGMLLGLDRCSELLEVHHVFDYRLKRMTILVPSGTSVPADGACSRAMPVPSNRTSSPAMLAVSTTWRSGSPTKDGTAMRCLSSTTIGSPRYGRLTEEKVMAAWASVSPVASRVEPLQS